MIAGRGSYLPDLQSQIDVEGVSDIVELPGYVPDASLRALAHRAGVVVVPSLYEPFGIVALEALAAGAPLIVARTGGLAELLADTEAGITFEPGNPEDLARCITEVLTDRDLAAGLMSQGRALVEQTYAWDAIAAVHGGRLRRAAHEHAPLRLGTLARRCAPCTSSPSSAASRPRSNRSSVSPQTCTGPGIAS